MKVTGLAGEVTAELSLVALLIVITPSAKVSHGAPLVAGLNVTVASLARPVNVRIVLPVVPKSLKAT